jgi:peptidyl-prolyl cis-trans isomerase SurA
MKRILASLVLAAVVSSASMARAEIIDRILAVVDGAIIMQSDVTLAMRLTMVPASAPDAIPAALEALIERRLILAEVDRYAPPDPPESEVDRHLAEIRTRAGAKFDTTLVECGVSIEQLRRQVRDDLRMEAYLLQRFGSTQPSDEEILAYYRDHQVAYTKNGVVRPLDDVRETVRAAIITEQRNATIRDWVTGLRRRANVNVLPR